MKKEYITTKKLWDAGAILFVLSFIISISLIYIVFNVPGEIWNDYEWEEECIEWSGFIDRDAISRECLQYECSIIKDTLYVQTEQTGEDKVMIHYCSKKDRVLVKEVTYEESRLVSVEELSNDI